MRRYFLQVGLFLKYCQVNDNYWVLVTKFQIKTIILFKINSWVNLVN